MKKYTFLFILCGLTSQAVNASFAQRFLPTTRLAVTVGRQAIVKTSARCIATTAYRTHAQATFAPQKLGFFLSRTTSAPLIAVVPLARTFSSTTIVKNEFKNILEQQLLKLQSEMLYTQTLVKTYLQQNGINSTTTAATCVPLFMQTFLEFIDLFMLYVKNSITNKEKVVLNQKLQQLVDCLNDIKTLTDAHTSENPLLIKVALALINRTEPFIREAQNELSKTIDQAINATIEDMFSDMKNQLTVAMKNSSEQSVLASSLYFFITTFEELMSQRHALQKAYEDEYLQTQDQAIRDIKSTIMALVKDVEPTMKKIQKLTKNPSTQEKEETITIAHKMIDLYDVVETIKMMAEIE